MKNRVLVLVMAMGFLALVSAGSAEAAQKRVAQVRAHQTGVREVIAGGPSYGPISVLKYWKSGWRYYFIKI